ncbi:hypothetical protein ACFSO0_19570 [Brevibacillus sp. GCM10020057]|uniref:hypothetical protein n=1 Tax=Brevibacillus sp. GCM10020057 TaxID=3317327 RepID=UPI00362970E5
MLSKNFGSAQPCVFLAAIAAYLLFAFYPSELLHWVISLLSIVIVIVVFRTVPRFVQGLSALFLLVGISLLLASGAAWPMFVTGFGNMLNILSLFALIPLIALPIELGNYAVRIQQMISRRIKGSGWLYTMTAGLSYILSSFMNIATLPMVYQTIRPSLELFPIEQKERFISRAITHGYSMPIVWTPVAPIVGIIVEMTGVQWSAILPIMVPFSILGLVLDAVMGQWIARRRLKQLDPAAVDELAAARQGDERPVQDRPASHPVHILAAILVFTCLIALLETYTHYSFLLLVSVAVVPFALAWSLLIGAGRQFVRRGVAMLPVQLLKMKEQFIVFLSAGFMISAIQTSGAGHVINAWIMAGKQVIGADLFLILIPLIPLGLAFIGLHPAVGLALTAESLNPQAMGISPELTAIAMLTGAATAFLMGPYNATAGMMAHLTRQSPIRISNWNAPFTLAYLMMAMILLIILKKVY